MRLHPKLTVLDAVEVRGKRLTKDQKGEAQQYSKNVSNAYLGKEYLERYRVQSAGDVLKGLNGVYNIEHPHRRWRDYTQYTRHYRQRPYPRNTGRHGTNGRCLAQQLRCGRPQLP